MKSLGLPKCELAKTAREVDITYSTEGLGRKCRKGIEALEKVRSLGLPRYELARIAREVDITYGIKGLGRKCRKGLEALEKVRSLSLPEGQLARIAPEPGSLYYPWHRSSWRKLSKISGSIRKSEKLGLA